MKRRRLLGKQSGYILYTITTVNKKYGDNNFINPLSISGNGTVTYTSSNTAAATIDSSTGEVTIVAPGTSIITATTNDTLDYIYDVKDTSYTLIVAKADGNVSEAPAPQLIIYDGNPHNLVSTGSGTGTMMYRLGDSGEFSTTIPSATNAGEYVVYYKASESVYYTESNVGSVTITILKASPTYTAPTATSPVYNETALDLLNAGSTSCGLIEYSDDEITWSTTIPQGTNAGLYTSYWRLTGNSNYNNISSTSIITTIDKVTPTVIPPVGLAISYDGESHQLIDPNNPGSTDYGILQYSLDGVTYSTSIPTASALGDYIVYYRVEGNSNVYDVAYSTVLASIGGTIVQNPIIELEYNSCNYDGTAKQPSVVVKDDDGEIIPSNEYTVNYSNNIDAGTAAVTITDIPGGTYIINGNAAFTINPINPTYTAPTAKTGLVYNCSSQLLLNSGSVTSGGTMYYSSDGINWSENNTCSETNAGIYNTYWKIVKANNNYNDIGPTSITTTISTCTPVITAPTAKTLTYNTSAQILANAGSINGSCSNCASLEYSLDNSTWSSSVPSATNAGSYIVYYRIPGDSNINEVTGNIECIINAKVPSSITVELIQSTYTYDGNAKTPTVTVKDGSTTIPSSEYTINYTNNTNAGTATITITDKSGGNYSFTTLTVNFIINKATIYPVVSMSGWTYEKTPTSPSITGNSGNGTVTYYYKVNSADDSTYTGTKPGSTSTATTYKVKAVVEETTNYLGATVYTTFDISKAPGRVTISGRTLTYNGNSQNLVTVSGATGTMHYRIGTSGEWSTDIPTITNKTSSSNTDSWTIYYYIDASTNYNGCGSSSSPCGNVSTTMEKLTPTITAPTAKSAQAYTSSALALANAGSTNYGTLLYSLDHSNWGTSIPTAINNGTYLVYYRVEGNNNVYSMPKESPYYYTVSSTSSIVEKTITATVIPEYSSTEYDKTAKTPSVTVKDGNTVIPSSEYTVSYSDNINAGTAKITITDKSGGNYAVTGEVEFTITLKEVCLTWGTTLSWTYDGSAHGTTCDPGCLISGDPCSVTLSGNSITNKGTTTVTATGLSNSNYKLPSSGLSKTLTISARPINVTAGSNSKTYDGSALTYNSATAEGTGTNRGLVSGHSMTSCTVTGTITNKGSVNNVPSSAVIKNSGGTDVTSNYSINYVNGTLTINARETIVTAGSTSKTYDGSALTYNSASASNLASGHTLSSYSCSGSITNKGSVNNVPSAAVIKSGSTDVSSNYSISYANGTLTINARPINVTAGTTSKTYDGSALTYNSATAESTGTNRGLVSGHSMTSCTVSGSITTKGSTNNVPSGAVIKSGSTDVTSNYSINYVNGTLTINARAVTYRANDESWTYDENTHSASNTATLTSGSLVSGHSATFSCSGSVGAGVGSATKTLSTVTIKSGSTDVSGNYTITRNNGTLTINAKCISIPTPAGYSNSYDGYSHTATFYSTEGASITKYAYSYDGNSWTETNSNPSLTNARTLYTKAYYTASTNYTCSGWSSNATITISRSCTSSASGIDRTYNGTTDSNGSALNGVSGSYVNWDGTTSATNAGSYTAYATPDENHLWSDNCGSEQRAIYWTIYKRDLTAPTLSGSTVTYENGTASASISSYGKVYGTDSLAPGTIIWSDQSRSSVGLLTAYAYHAATSNFNQSPSGSATVTVNQASDASVTVTRTNRTYNESSLTIASIASAHGCSNYSIGLGSSSLSAPSSWSSSLSATSCGTYYVWKKWTADSNHSNSSNGVYEGEVSIALSSNYNITATPIATNTTYNGSALYLLTGGSASISGTFSYNSATNAETYIGTWTFTPNNSCYTLMGGYVPNCKINTRPITVTGASNSKTYDGTSISVSGASITSGLLASGHTITYSTSGASQTVVGSATNTVNSVTIRDGNGNDVTSNYSITKYSGYAKIYTRAITVLAGGGTWTYDGNAHSNTTGGSVISGSLPSGHTITYSCSGSITNAGSVTNTLNSVTIRNSGGTDVTSSFSITMLNNTLYVNKASCVPYATANSWTYDGYSRDMLYNVGGCGTIYYIYNDNWTTTMPLAVNAGNYSITLYSTGDDNHDAAYSSLYTCTVGKASNSIGISGNSWTYDGVTRNMVSSSGIGTPYYSVNDGSLTGTMPTANGVGSWSIRVYYDGDSNHYDGWSNYAYCNVYCKQPYAPYVQGSSTTYPTVATAYASGDGDTYIEWESSASQTSVGSHTTRARWAADANHCASDWSSYVTVEMIKANSCIYFDGNGSVERGSTMTKQAVNCGGDGSITYSSSNTGIATVNSSGTVTGVSAGTCTITATISGTSNYNSASTSYTLTVTDAFNGHPYVNLGLPSGTLWAKYFVGASSETDYGNYYQCGAGSTTYANSTQYYTQIEDIPLSYDTARLVMGGSWKMPTETLLQELLNNTTRSDTTVNGVRVMILTSTINGNTLTMPYGGSYINGALYNKNKTGYFWSYTYLLGTGTKIKNYQFEYTNTGTAKIAGSARSNGLNVRGVIS